MHLLLTDRLTCPRCGPPFGLILRADRMEGRRVLDGVLGCPNCRDAFPVTDGFADLRAPPRDALGPGLAGVPEGEGDEAADPSTGAGAGAAHHASRPRAERAQRLVALLGIVGGPGTVALVGEPATLAPALAASLGEMQVVAVDPDLRHWRETEGVSRLAAAPGLPFFDKMLRGVVVDGRLGAAWLEEAARVVQPRGRLVVLHASEGARQALEARGLTVLVAEPETVVAARG